MTGTGFSRSPRLVRGGIVLLDPSTGTVVDIIALQYNPDTVNRSFQVQAVGETTDRAFPLRLKAPPVETIKVDAELDAADQLEFPERFPDVAELGIHPQLALLESLTYPTVSQLVATDRIAAAGTLEVAPVESPLTVFVWSASRIVPVRVTDLSVTEEAFDPKLNPLRAKVSFGLRVLSVNDVGYKHRAGALYLAHQRRKEQLAGRVAAGAFSTLGIGGIP
jgi:hypothetical protein